MNTLAIQRVKEFLKAHPSITSIEKDGGIGVESKDETGFTVWLQERKSGEIIVGYDGWHEHFEDVDEALKYFHFGLSDGGRLKVTERGGFRYKWLLQIYQDGEWVDDQITGLFFFPFWRRKKEYFLRNHWISRP